MCYGRRAETRHSHKMTERTRQMKLVSYVWMVIPLSSLKPAEEMENTVGSVMSDLRSLSFSTFLTPSREAAQSLRSILSVAKLSLFFIYKSFQDALHANWILIDI